MKIIPEARHAHLFQVATGDTRVAGTAYPSQAPEFTPGFSGFVVLDI
jgi:hypothetical protein